MSRKNHNKRTKDKTVYRYEDFAISTKVEIPEKTVEEPDLEHQDEFTRKMLNKARMNVEAKKQPKKSIFAKAEFKVLLAFSILVFLVVSGVFSPSLSELQSDNPLSSADGEGWDRTGTPGQGLSEIGSCEELYERMAEKGIDPSQIPKDRLPEELQHCV